MSAPPTVAILSIGEMGAAVGGCLRAAGHRVVTYVAGRSPATAERAHGAGIEIISSLTEVATIAAVVVSLAPPTSALEVARGYRAVAAAAPADQIYIDANSIAPGTARRIEAELAGTPIAFVDGALYGAASRLDREGTLLLSGPEAPRAAALLGGGLRVREAGPVVGQASARKMLLAGLTKGLCALVLEVGAIADRLGALDAALDDYREHYPGVMELVDRMLPTYPQHASRRADELAELLGLAREVGGEPVSVRAAEQVTRALAELHLTASSPTPSGSAWTTERVITAIGERCRP